jgi:hypothetical protein
MSWAMVHGSMSVETKVSHMVVFQRLTEELIMMPMGGNRESCFIVIVH